MPATSGPLNGHSRIILEWVMKVAGPVALVLFGFMLNMLVSFEGRMDAHEQDIVGIQANRFTANDGADMQRQMGGMVTREELAGELTQIQLELREIRQLIAANGRE